jgi:acyl-[acyl-carrier-protein]-phospholipid O-acyltransferase/long-chain-fatty-acid--[acyl-carrier-protein] ligase
MSHANQFALLKTKRFWPLFVTQAIGAFNDNAFRYSLSIILIYDIGKRAGIDGSLLNTVSAGLLTLPFFLFSATAGQLADKLDKAWLAQRIKLAEIAVIALASVSLFTDMVWLQLLCVFLTGTQSAFFGPIKYSILPQHLEKGELLGGNGLVEMGTFLSVLLGTMFGGFFILSDFGRHGVSIVMIGLAVIAYLSARQIPPAPPPQPDLKLNRNIIAETWHVVAQARERYDVFQAILGISWFWFLGVVFLTQIPFFTESDLGADQFVANVIITVFSIAIGAGSIVTNRLLKGEVSVKYVPLAAILMTLFIVDLWLATGQFRSVFAGHTPVTAGAMLSSFSGWRVLVDLGMVAFLAGIYVVPLYALAQTRAAPPRRARVIAANNIINAVFMTVATLLSALLIAAGFSARGLFLLLGLANAIAAVYAVMLLPQELIANFARMIFKLFFRVEVRGLENYAEAGRKAVIVANHQSLLDGPLLSAFLPERASFAINSFMAKRWWVKPAFHMFNILPIDPTNPMALRSLVRELDKGRKVVIFPEGRLTITGSLMKVYEGPGTIAHMANAKVLPVRIDGAQFSQFSKMRGKLRLKWFPKITLTYLPPVKFDTPEGLKGSDLREHLADKLYDVMTGMMLKSSPGDKMLFDSVLDARKAHGGKHKIVEDVTRSPISYDRIVLGSFILGRKIAALTPNQKNVGVLLPNAAGNLITFFGLHIFGRVPAMLNFSTGPINMSAACTAAQVTTIITSRRFIEAAEMQNDLAILEKSCRIVYLEDVRESVGLGDKLYGLFARTFSGRALSSAGASRDPNSAAVILFTSGSEGVPKGVVLSHRNLQANRYQVAARIDFSASDLIFNALPMFHAFGLTIGTLLPVLSGVKVFLYPSPLHYKIVPELCYDTNATILLGTDTFLTGYAKNAHPYDFFAMRMVVAGAERVKPETREIWMERFGIRIIEGYGATECAPVLAANTPMHMKYGTVGRMFDGIEYRIEPVEGIAEGGRLIVKGPNVMLGYLRADNPGVIEPPPDGWYDTGDIVKVDAQGFITILGRAKRFAKIAGEMVSLTAVEIKVQTAYPEDNHAAVAVPDKKKGEQLVLFTTRAGLDRKELADAMKKAGAVELIIPRNIIVMKELPVLGSGKTDYQALNRMGREQVKE